MDGWTVKRMETVDSTNNELKRMAALTAADRLAVIARQQSAGRGRQGRAFQSPPGGLYLSVLLRPAADLADCARLTPWAAIAVCDAVEAVAGLRPGIKWPNDVIANGKKLCGILTELALTHEGALDYVICGMGLNVSQTDFGPISHLATSLALETGRAPGVEPLSQALLSALSDLYQGFPDKNAHYLSRYRSDCLTLGRQVRLLRGDREEIAQAEDVDGQFGLIVRFPDGHRETIRSGEVSVRGLMGYV